MTALVNVAVPPTSLPRLGLVRLQEMLDRGFGCAVWPSQASPGEGAGREGDGRSSAADRWCHPSEGYAAAARLSRTHRGAVRLQGERLCRMPPAAAYAVRL